MHTKTETLCHGLKTEITIKPALDQKELGTQ